ncbi:Cupin superfamily protein [Paraburkholderia megapolitana]|uniref:Cupin superfamily protein n=2 Tax=Paraburkholderia megapolitana TaxID=420953 RepID=A0A1I3WAB8_9BURK|nr:Cupin superfamily protein [Paraburkholderia megapolitana]
MRPSPSTLSRYMNETALGNLSTSESPKAHFVEADLHDVLPKISIIEKDLYSFFKKFSHDTQKIRLFSNRTEVSDDVSSFLGNYDSLLQLSRDLKLTLYLTDLHQHVAYLGEFAAMMGNSLDADITISAFVSPEDSAYTPVHYDYHDVFAYQIAGEKHWKCFDYSGKPSASLNGYQIDEALIGEEHLKGLVAPGHGVFIPTGVPHQAYTQSASSIHFSIGIRRNRSEEMGAALFSSTWRRVLSENKTRKLSPFSMTRLVAESLAHDVSESDLELLHNKWKIAKSSRYKRVHSTYNPDTNARFQLTPGSLYFCEETTEHLIVSFPVEFKQGVEIDIGSFSPGKLQLPKGAVALFDLLQKSPDGFSFSQVADLYGEATSHTVLAILIQHAIIRQFND